MEINAISGRRKNFKTFKFCLNKLPRSSRKIFKFSQITLSVSFEKKCNKRICVTEFSFISFFYKENEVNEFVTTYP